MSVRSKIVVFSIFVIAILLFIPNKFKVNHQDFSDREIKAKSAETAFELAQISATFLYNLDERQLKASLAPILKKKPYVQGLIIEDAITKKTFFTYFLDKNRPYFNGEIPEAITDFISSKAYITFDESILGHIEVYCKDVTSSSAFLPIADIDFTYKIRFLFGLSIILILAGYLAYKIILTHGKSDENPLAFGTNRFTIVVSITMGVLIILSIAGGSIIIDQNEKHIKEIVEGSLHQTLNSLAINILKVNEIRSGVHNYIASRPDYQTIFKNFIKAKDLNDKELAKETESNLLTFFNKHRLFNVANSKTLIDTRGRVLFSTDSAFTDDKIDKSSNGPFLCALAGRPSLLPPTIDSRSGIVKLYMAMPVFNKDKKVIGVSYQGIDKDRSVYTDMHFFDFADTGEILVVHKSGTIISNSRFNGDKKYSANYKSELKNLIQESVKYGKSGYNGEFGSVVDYRGKRVFTLVNWNDSYGIAFVAKIDQDEMLANFYNFQWGVYVVITLITLSSLIFTMLTLYVGRKANQQLIASRHNIIARLGHAAEFKDNDTGQHIARISLYSQIIAMELPTTKSWRDLLFNASPMHDIGKIGIPDSILNKPGKLTPDEWDVMKKHPEIGAAIIGKSNSDLLNMAKTIALYHHEKWDGSGYPNGVAGEEIPLSARIVAVADVFDALTSERVYKKAWPIKKAIDHIIEESGKHFDPLVVKAFSKSLSEIKEIQKKYADKLVI